jgi:hypothetical protein
MVARLHYKFKGRAFYVSGLTIVFGFTLFILGVTGVATLVVDANSIQGKLINGSPGLFFVVGGIVLAIVAVRKGIRERG